MWPSLSLQNHICNRGTELTINVKRQKFEQATLCRQKEGAGSPGGERRWPGACGWVVGGTFSFGRGGVGAHCVSASCPCRGSPQREVLRL